MDNKGFFSKTGMIVALVVLLSVGVGASAMSGLKSYASLTEYESPNMGNEGLNFDKEAQKARKEAEKARREAQREAAKARKEAAKARREARREAEKACREAQREAEKVRREAQREAEKVRKEVAKARQEAQREAEKARREARREAEKARKVAASATRGLEASTMRQSKKEEFTKRVEVAKFNKIEVSGMINVVYKEGNFPGYVEICTQPDYLDKIIVEESHGTLKLYNANLNCTSDTRFKVNIVAPTLSAVSIRDLATFKVEGQFSFTGSFILNADGISEANFGEVSGDGMVIKSSDASKVYVLTAKLDTLRATATDASSMRLKGLNVGTVIAKAESAATIGLGGRCRNLESESKDIAKVNARGIIVEKSSSIQKGENTSNSYLRKP